MSHIKTVQAGRRDYPQVRTGVTVAAQSPKEASTVFRSKIDLRHFIGSTLLGFYI